MAEGESKRVSVVTPVYNGGPYLAECIESVLAQTYPAFEYVICDNHSTDGTSATLARYASEDSRIRLVHPECFLPQIANWNFSASQASPGSAYVKFVHADDTLAPTCIERMVALAEAHPSVGMVGALRRVGEGEIDLDGIPPAAEVVPGRWLMRQQLTGGRYTTGTPTSTLLRYDRAFRTGTLYDPSYVHADDALAYRLLLDSDFGYVAEPLTYTRLHEASTTSWCDRVGTWLPEHFRMSLEFGPRVLSKGDVDRVARKWETEYALMLTKWTVTLKLIREREVLRYHRAALRLIERAADEAGQPLSRVLRAYARALAGSRADGSPFHDADAPAP